MESKVWEQPRSPHFLSFPVLTLYASPLCKRELGWRESQPPSGPLSCITQPSMASDPSPLGCLFLGRHRWKCPHPASSPSTPASAPELRTLPAPSFCGKTAPRKSARRRNAGNTDPRMRSVKGGLSGMLQECGMSSVLSVNQHKQLTFQAGSHRVRTWPARDRILIILILKKERNRPPKEILF